MNKITCTQIIVLLLGCFISACTSTPTRTDHELCFNPPHRSPSSEGGSCAAAFEKDTQLETSAIALPETIQMLLTKVDQADGMNYEGDLALSDLAEVFKSMTLEQRLFLRREIISRYYSVKKESTGHLAERNEFNDSPRRVLDQLINYDNDGPGHIFSALEKAKFWQNKRRIAGSEYMEFLESVHENYPNLRESSLKPKTILRIIDIIQTYLRSPAAKNETSSITIFGSIPSGTASLSSDIDLMVESHFKDAPKIDEIKEDLNQEFAKSLGTNNPSVEHAFPLEGHPEGMDILSPIQIKITAKDITLIIRPIGYGLFYSRGGGRRRLTPHAAKMVPVEFEAE